MISPCLRIARPNSQPLSPSFPSPPLTRALGVADCGTVPDDLAMYLRTVVQDAFRAATLALCAHPVSGPYAVEQRHRVLAGCRDLLLDSLTSP